MKDWTTASTESIFHVTCIVYVNNSNAVLHKPETGAFWGLVHKQLLTDRNGKTEATSSLNLTDAKHT